MQSFVPNVESDGFPEPDLDVSKAQALPEGE